MPMARKSPLHKSKQKKKHETGQVTCEITSGTHTIKFAELFGSPTRFYKKCRVAKIGFKTFFLSIPLCQDVNAFEISTRAAHQFEMSVLNNVSLKIIPATKQMPTPNAEDILRFVYGSNTTNFCCLVLAILRNQVLL